MKDAKEHKNVKGTKTGAVGRPSILPEQLGHEVKICGDNEYCLGCGRGTKAKHIDTAKHVFRCVPQCSGYDSTKRNSTMLVSTIGGTARLVRLKGQI
eukprot:10599328-Heterocapsa_arctica.AAC.1